MTSDPMNRPGCTSKKPARAKALFCHAPVWDGLVSRRAGRRPRHSARDSHARAVFAAAGGGGENDSAEGGTTQKERHASVQPRDTVGGRRQFLFAARPIMESSRLRAGAQAPAPRLKLSVEPIGPEIEGGINKSTLFDIDNATRVWKNRQLVGKDKIESGQEVQVNLTWGPFDSLATTDVWLDDESLAACREIQRQRHLRTHPLPVPARLGGCGEEQRHRRR